MNREQFSLDIDQQDTQCAFDTLSKPLTAYGIEPLELQAELTLQSHSPLSLDTDHRFGDAANTCEAKVASSVAPLFIWVVVALLAHGALLLMLEHLWRNSSERQIYAHTAHLLSIPIQATLLFERRQPIAEPSTTHQTAQSAVRPLKQPPAQTQAEVDTLAAAHSAQAATSDSLTSDSLGNEVVQRAEGAVSLLGASMSAINRFNSGRLDQLVERNATEYTQVKSLSEMDGDMEVLTLPKKDEWQVKASLDHQFDPNRVVKVGSTCYRIVQNGNPINPHASNLGFPFRCDGKSLVEDLKKAFQARGRTQTRNN